MDSSIEITRGFCYRDFYDNIKKRSTGYYWNWKYGDHTLELANAMIYSGLNVCTVEMPLDAAAYEAMLMNKIKNSTHEKEVKTSGSSSDDFSKSF